MAAQPAGDRRPHRALPDLAVRGRGRALVVAGVPGIGRTALLNWAAASASGRFRETQVAGHVRDQPTPGIALVELARQLGSAFPEGLHPPVPDGIAAGRAADLAAFMPSSACWTADGRS